jgi:hypothetical protein
MTDVRAGPHRGVWSGPQARTLLPPERWIRIKHSFVAADHTSMRSGSPGIPLTAQSATELLERFGEFHDATVRRVEIAPPDHHVVVELDAEDRTTEWSKKRIVFRSDSLREWRLVQINSTVGLYVFEAAILVDAGLVTISFDYSLAENPSADDLRGSDFYLGAESFTWEVTEVPP